MRRLVRTNRKPPCGPPCRRGQRVWMDPTERPRSKNRPTNCHPPCGPPCRVGGDKGCGWILPKGHDQRTDPQTVTRLAGPRVGGDKGCGWILPKGHDQRTGPQTVTRLAGPRVGGDKGCGWILPKGHDQRTDPQTVTRLAGKGHKTSVLRVANETQP